VRFAIALAVLNAIARQVWPGPFVRMTLTPNKARVGALLLVASAIVAQEK
jgi:hypothetical protein